MKNVRTLMECAILSVVLPVGLGQAAESFDRFTGRVGLGGIIPEDPELTEFGGPVSGQKMKLDPGFELHLEAAYRITPWLEVGPEVGLTFNTVDSIGGWSYPDTILGQIPMMMNVRLEYPVEGRVAPFVGAGVGGVASFLTFGSSGGGHYGYYDYYYYDHGPDATGWDVALAFQAFGGVCCRVGENWSLNLEYRYLLTDAQRWNVEWRHGGEFGVGIDSLHLHTICLVFSGTL